MPTGNSLVFFLGEEDQTDNKTGHCRKLMHNTPDAKIKGDQGFYGFGVENDAETAVISQIMIQAKGKCVNNQGNGKGHNGQGKTLSSHG